ncbi:MAG: hypothetical protein ACXVAN_03420, partial [Polyangia bacterium]
PEARMRTLVGWVERRLRRARPDPLVVHAVRGLEATHGARSIAAGLSRPPARAHDSGLRAQLIDLCADLSSGVTVE